MAILPFKDFQIWLKNHNYKVDDFVRSEFGTYGSYGGKINSDDPINNQPVIFVHGNSDVALETSHPGPSTGWRNSIKYVITYT